MVQEDQVDDNNKKWFGFPPKGERPVPQKWRYILEILMVILVEFVLWAIYRVVSAPFISPFGSLPFYIAHIIFAPLIHLGPIIVYWKFIRKETGHPFIFTRKKLMSGIMIGLTSAIVWRVLEMVIGDTLYSMAGGTAFGTMAIYSWLDSTTLLLFGLMTFTHFFIVGPVEELQFRSFVHDQATRVMPLWQALTFSSILFGLAHVPIAITVYRMSVGELIVAEIGWMSAGAVFGALYMWSRNIFACIIMHGMGNWQLSVFLITGQIVPGGMSNMTALVMGTLTALIVNAIMIFLFYLLFKYYWEPQRNGEVIFGGHLAKLKRSIYEHDYGLGGKTILNTSTRSAVFCVFVCLLVLLGTFAVGETDLSRMIMHSTSSDTEALDISSLTISNEPGEYSGSLGEGETMTYTFTSAEGKYLRGLSVTLTWSDEPDKRNGLRYYENTPDTFSLTLEGDNITDSHSGTNPKDGECTVVASVSYTDEQISNLSAQGANYTIDVNVCLESAGNYEARVGLGVLQLVDNSNDFQCIVEAEYLISDTV